MKSHLYQEFKGTIIERVIDSVRSQVPFPLGRVRLAKLMSGRCYSFHQDFDIRIQVPITTNTESLIFVGKEKIYHLPADGRSYVFDSRIPHTAINGHLTDERVHLLFSLVAEDQNAYSSFMEKMKLKSKEAEPPKRLSKISSSMMTGLFGKS